MELVVIYRPIQAAAVTRVQAICISDTMALIIISFGNWTTCKVYVSGVRVRCVRVRCTNVRVRCNPYVYACKVNPPTAKLMVRVRVQANP